MKRILLLVLLLVGLHVNSSTFADEAEQFRFTNWPVADFEMPQVLKPFGIEYQHFGVDIEAAVGEEVAAVADGVVYWTYTGGSHGIAAGIEHNNGMRTTYSHLLERSVKKGQQVKAGEVIGKVGTTGTGRDSEAPHLHFALIKDPGADINKPLERYANPLDFGPLTQTPTNQEQPAQQPIDQPLPQLERAVVESAPNPVATTIPVIERAPEQALQKNVTANTAKTSLASMQNKLKKKIKSDLAQDKPLIVKESINISKKSINPKALRESIAINRKASKVQSTVTANKLATVPPVRKQVVEHSYLKSGQTGVKILTILISGLLLLAILLANFIRKSYNVVLTW